MAKMNNPQSTSSNEYRNGGNMWRDVKKKNNNGAKKAPQNKATKARPYVKPTEMRAGREFEYKMSPEMWAELVKLCKKEKGGDIQTYACNYVNEQFGLLGTCVSVIVG